MLSWLPYPFFPSFYVWTTPNSFEIIFLLFTIASIATIGNFLWTKALSQEALTNLMPFEFSKLLFATILGILFFNEKVDLITIFSGTGLLCLNHYLAKSITKNEKLKDYYQIFSCFFFSLLGYQIKLELLTNSIENIVFYRSFFGTLYYCYFSF